MAARSGCAARTGKLPETRFEKGLRIRERTVGKASANAKAQGREDVRFRVWLRILGNIQSSKLRLSSDLDSEPSHSFSRKPTPTGKRHTYSAILASSHEGRAGFGRPCESSSLLLSWLALCAPC